MVILETVQKCIDAVVENLTRLEIEPSDIVAIGVTNQRETTIAWDKITGKPLCNAIGKKPKTLEIAMIKRFFSMAGHEDVVYGRQSFGESS